MAGCSSKDTGTATQGYKGVINFKAFAMDYAGRKRKRCDIDIRCRSQRQPENGQSQYLSRVYDDNNGVSIVWDYCERQARTASRVVYAQAPISKEDALSQN